MGAASGKRCGMLLGGGGTRHCRIGGTQKRGENPETREAGRKGKSRMGKRAREKGAETRQERSWGA